VVTQQEILETLKKVKDPELRVSIVDLGMVKHVNIRGNTVEVTLALTVPSCPLSSTIEKDVKTAVTSLPGVNAANVKFVSMTKDERENIFRKLGRRLGVEKMEKTGIKHIIAVTSGKGGVGKSSVTALFATELKKQGLDVGILDSDITGPSIAKMFGVSRLDISDKGIAPARSKTGIEIMSMQMLLKKPDDPVIWRGPILHNVVTQMYKDVTWGELDYLLVDVPPGTSDIPLTLYQTFPLDGVVVVATPQDLVTLIVRKAVNMTVQLKVPVLGLVENMSHARCPKCGEKIEPWGPARGEKTAKELNIPFLGSLPIDSRIAELCDAGHIEEYSSEASSEIARRLLISQMSSSNATFLNWTLT